MIEVPFWWLCRHQFYLDGNQRSTSGPQVCLKLCILGLQKRGVNYSSNALHMLFLESLLGSPETYLVLTAGRELFIINLMYF